jgi:glycolate oxidase subunit GlcD
MKFSVFEKMDLEFLRGVVGNENVSTEESELIIQANDAFPSTWVKPDAVVWPEDAKQVSQILKYANERRLPVTPRGAGSSLSGNVIPVNHGIVMNMRRMNRIVEVLEKDLQVRVQPGVVYDELNAKLQPSGLFFPPDPGSSSVCTIGGMIANNASGLGAVKYGVTRDYVLGLEVVLPDGSTIRTGSRAVKSSVGYDLIGLFVGSEGTLGVVTEITLRLRTQPEARKAAVASFNSVSDATDAVNEIVTSGLGPAALEFLDYETIVAINRAKGLGLNETAAMLLIEFHGSKGSIEQELNLALNLCKRHSASEIREARNEDERHNLWVGRKAAYPSLVQSARSVIIGDIVVPISKITEMVDKAYKIAAEHGVKVACFGHCGDGNVHPNFLTDRNDKDLWQRALNANDATVTYAIKLGGVASGEHGIGLEKKQFMEMQHGESLGLMRSIKSLLDPNDIMNPGKFVDL